MRWETVEQPHDKFWSWMKEIVQSGPLELYIQTIVEDNNGIKVRFFTEEHCYALAAIYPSDDRPNGYLGGGATIRKLRAGEDHTRGNDLPDGHFNEDTWNSIVRAIMSHELVKLAPSPTLIIPIDSGEGAGGIQGGANAPMEQVTMPSLTRGAA